MITVIVPTISSRSHWLDRCKVSYAAHTTDYELIVVPDQPDCGTAWLLGVEKAQGDYIHFSADDLEAHQGWWQAAVETVKEGALPAPLIYYPDGTVQSSGGSWEQTEPDGKRTDFTRIPFVSRRQWEQLGPLITPFLEYGPHYYTDNIFSWAGAKHWVLTRNCHGYKFTHHSATEGRNEARMSTDGALYDNYRRRFT